MKMNQNEIDIIQKVSRSLSSKFTFGYYDKEDIEQEAFLIGMEGLNKFDPSNGASLESFLYTHIGNRLKNFIRNKFVRRDHKCKHCNNENVECPFCQRREWRFAVKRHLMEPIDIDRVNGDNESNMYTVCNPLNRMELNEILRIIDEHLDIQLRADYLRMLEGLYVQKSKREIIESQILEILEEHGYDRE